MRPIDELSDKDYTKLITEAWDFGCMDKTIPKHAARLWHDGFAKHILVSGASGTLNANAKKTEAEIFRDILVVEGVEPAAIILEKTATNIRENVLFGMEALIHKGVCPKKLCIVAKPFAMRRCAATFKKCFPKVEVIPTPPPGKPLDFLDRSRRVYIERLVAELERLQLYGDKGDIAPVHIPEKVRLAAVNIERYLQQ